MDKPYNLAFGVGDHLIIELNTKDIFEGQYNDGGRNRIDLVNTRQHNNPNKLGGVYSFYRNEIANIQKLKIKVTEKPETQNQKKAVADTSECKRIGLIEEDYIRLKEMSKNARYVEQVDCKYYEAVKNLSEAETIGIVSLGMEANKAAIIRLLVICTWQEVYIFDLINLKKRFFYPELKDILESEYTTKVIHGGGPLIDILYRNYDVYVRNVFDTQIVDLIIEKSKNKTIKHTKNISECLVNYFNFPKSFLNDALAVSRKSWMERPLTEGRKQYAAQLGTYLTVLRQEMQNILLKPVHKAIDDVHNIYYKLNDYDFSVMCNNEEVTKDIADVIPKLLDIDKE